VILVDIIIPRLDGFQTCTLIRHFDNFRNTPMIMLTSKDGRLARTRSQIAASEQYLTKPFTRDQLAGAISRQINSAAT